MLPYGHEEVVIVRPTQEWIDELNTRIDRGAEFLKKHKGPRWDKGIDLSVLEMTSSCRCVCGQSFRDQATATQEDDGYWWFVGHLMPQDTPAAYGFTLNFEEWFSVGATYSDINGSLLGDLWRARILAKRRKEKRNLLRG